MKQFFLFIAFLSFAGLASAQQEKLYHPEANAENDLAAALKKAKAEHKYLLVQGGGNWCHWCIEFARFAKADHKIDSVINSAYVWYHLNFSPENQNKKMFSKLGHPQRFSFPVFIILDENGNRLHTQNSEYLENGNNSYSQQKVQSFLEMWTPHVMDPHMWGDDVKAGK